MGKACGNICPFNVCYPHSPLPLTVKNEVTGCVCAHAKPLSHSLYSFVVEFVQYLLWYVNIGEEMVYFGQSNLPDRLQFHNQRERRGVYHVQPGHVVCDNLVYLRCPLPGDIEFMAEVAVCFVARKDSDWYIVYCECWDCV